MGSCAEKICTEMTITRQAQDEYAIQSYTRAREASKALEWEIVGVIKQSRKGEVVYQKDQEVERFAPEQFARLRPLFAKNGSITTANSSKIADGACALLLMSE